MPICGERRVVVLGQRKAVGIAVRGGNTRPRWTKLREWLDRGGSVRAAADPSS